MKLRARLILVIGLTTLVPLILAGGSSSRLARQSAIDQATDLHARQAAGLAVLTATWISDLERSVSLAVDIWDLENLEPQERVGLQRVLYRQFDAVNIVQLLDPQGRPVGEPTHLTAEALTRAGGLVTHQAVEQARLDRFLEQLAAEPSAHGIGTIYDPGDGAAPVVRVAVPSERLTVATEVSLAELESHFLDQAVEGGIATLLDARGGRVFDGPELPVGANELVQRFQGQLSGELIIQDDEPVLAAFHGVAGTQWTVVVAVPERVVNAGGERLREQTLYLYLVAMVLAVTTGAVAAGQISRPVVRLKRASEDLGRGELGKQVPSDGSDELAELAQSFNSMSLALRDSAKTIEDKNREIEAFNAVLQERVDQRTSDLRESQARLVQSSRMAAVAQLGAGLAHELNNPLAGILGLAQVARAGAQGEGIDPMLAQIEAQALRCKEIVATLHRFSGASGEPERVPLNLAQVMAEVLVLSRGALEQAGLHADARLDQELPVAGDPARLGQALAQLLKSAQAELAPGGHIVVHGRVLQDQASIELELVGDRRPSQDDWLASGMGFWVAQQVLHEHGGGLEQPDDGRYAAVLPTR